MGSEVFIMADCVAVPPHNKFHFNKYCVNERRAGPKYPLFKISRASPFKVNFLSSGSICKLSALHISNIKAGPYNKECFLKGHCLGTLINFNGAATSEWILVIDQVLLMSSVLLTYMAGVIPIEKSLLNSRSFLQDRLVPEDSAFSGAADDGDEVNLKFAWAAVRSKLVDGLSTIESSGNLGNEVIGKGQQRPSSLLSIYEAPRFRLMLACIHWLQKEVDNVPGNSSSMAVREVFFPQIIQRSCETLCIAWLAEELRLKDSGGDERLLSAIGEKISGYDSITQNIKKSGKNDLYAELVCILRFGSLWKNSCYNYNFFSLHGVPVLEDLVISLADGISSMYLELISVDGNMSNEMNSLGLNLCSLSTRALQRLRNEVVLSQWLYQNMDAVASMYEDRFDLRTLDIQVIQNPINSEMQKFSWWKNLGWVKAQPPLRFFVINNVSVPVKRTKELRSLTGWRYYYSLFLELADISMPLIRTIVAKVSDAISFFLVSLIGRSLGLIYTGIKQSLRWK